MLVMTGREQRGGRDEFNDIKDRIGFCVFGVHSAIDEFLILLFNLFLISARFYDLADELRRFSVADVMRNDAPADALTSVKVPLAFAILPSHRLPHAYRHAPLCTIKTPARPIPGLLS